MAIKKNEIYSSLDASCDKLRGGMDPSQYKNYILSLLFMKYVTVKFKGKPYPQVTVPEGGSFDDLKALRGEIATSRLIALAEKVNTMPFWADQHKFIGIE